jgi:hypothetical protein
MSFVGAAIAGGTALIGGVISSGANSRATRRATDASMQATQENNALAREIFAQNKETLSPFVQQGGRATSFINRFLGIDGPPAGTVQAGGQPGQMGEAGAQPDVNGAFGDFRNSTGYDFRFNEGLRALRAQQGARGLGTSSDTFRRAMSLGQEMGSAESGNFLNALLTQQQLGANAAGNQAGVASNFSAQVQANNAQNASNIGNAALAQAGNNNAFLSSLVGAAGTIAGGRR